MNENSLKNNNLEKKKPGYTTYTGLEDWDKDHPQDEINPEKLHSYEEEKLELQILFTQFEENHSLEKLHEIIELSPELTELFMPNSIKSLEERALLKDPSPEDLARYTIRMKAKDDLIPIANLLNKIKKDTAVTDAQYNSLEAMYKTLSRAVGMFVPANRKIDHTR